MTPLVDGYAAFLHTEAACLIEVHDKATQTVEDTEADTLRARLISRVGRALLRRYAQNSPNGNGSGVGGSGCAYWAAGSNRVIPERPPNPCQTCQHGWRPWQTERNHVNELLQCIGENSSKATAAAAAVHGAASAVLASRVLTMKDLSANVLQPLANHVPHANPPTARDTASSSSSSSSSSSFGYPRPLT
ncbi:hypothetical protein SprV_0602174100 [Sparganum proliferum]